MKKNRVLTILSLGQEMQPIKEFNEAFCTENNFQLTAATDKLSDQLSVLSVTAEKADIQINPDVIMIRTAKLTAVIQTCINKLKAAYPAANLIAVTNEFYPKTQNEVFGLFSSLKYPESEDERQQLDFSRRLILAVRNARLASYVASLGYGGRWVMLPDTAYAAVSFRGGTEQHDVSLVAIGASAGGTYAISEVVSTLPKELPCVLIVQHIPAEFVSMFADSLSKVAATRVRVAQDKDPIEAGLIYLAPGDVHMTVEKFGTELRIRTLVGDKVSGHRPSVDMLFRSVAEAAGSKAIGVILTGMGADGAEGLLAMHKKGAYTIGQDKASSAVYGMPEVAFSKGAVSKQLPLSMISAEIINHIFGRDGKLRL